MWYKWADFSAPYNPKNFENLKMLKYIDIFAGCGGLSLGFYNVGWKAVFAIEKSPFAFSTLKHNLIDNKRHFEWVEWLEVKENDIKNILKSHKQDLEKLQGTIDLVVGGPPCQGFSFAGKREKSDERNHLVYSYIDFIKIVQPKALFFENVRGFSFPFKDDKETENLAYSEIVLEELESLGYKAKPKLIDFGDFGVPQRRKRFIIVGFKEKEPQTFFDLLESKKDEFLKNKNLSADTKIEDAISDLLQSNGQKPSPDTPSFFAGTYTTAKTNLQKYLRNGNGDSSKVVDSHRFTKHQPETIEIFKKLLKEATRDVKIVGKEKEKFGLKKRGVTVMDAKTKSPTLTTHPDDYIHYSEPRILTVREYARLQTFPDWFEFKEKYTTGGKLRRFEVPRYTQVGNAIPPLFAELVAIVLKEILE